MLVRFFWCGLLGLPLVDRQVAVFQLQDCGVDCGDVDVAVGAVLPGAVGGLSRDENLEELVPVFGPFFFVAEHDLGEVVVQVVPMAEAVVLDGPPPAARC